MGRTTLNIDDTLLREAQDVTGTRSKTETIELGLRLLVERAAAERLALAGGTMPNFEAPPRRSRT